MANDKGRGKSGDDRDRTKTAGTAATRGSGAHAGSDVTARDEASATRSGGARSGTSTSTRGTGEEELDDTMLCDYGPCGCEEADVERGAQRFCSETCADLAAEADESAEAESDDENLIEASGEEQCACGHAECEAAMTAGAGEESGTGRNVPRSHSGRE